MSNNEYVKQMTPAAFVGLRRHCIDLVREAVKAEYDHDVPDLFEKTAARAELLPFTTPVIKTLMGIVGFWNYRQDHEPNLGYFIRDATHDLNECINNCDKEWFAPRTEQYCEFFKPLPEGLVTGRTPVNIVSSFFYYMWNRWCEEECKLVFGWNYKHFWGKWCYHQKKFSSGAAECFYAELDMGNQQRLVERALQCYDQKLHNIK